MSRQILVFGRKTFRVAVPDGAKITFGPWSPPAKDARFNNERDARGTLRIYGRTKEDVLAVFSGVAGFRDLSLEYMEEVAKEEGATIWKSDEHGYMRETKASGTAAWVKPNVPELSEGEPL